MQTNPVSQQHLCIRLGTSQGQGEAEPKAQPKEEEERSRVQRQVLQATKKRKNVLSHLQSYEARTKVSRSKMMKGSSGNVPSINKNSNTSKQNTFSLRISEDISLI